MLTSTGNQNQPKRQIAITIYGRIHAIHSETNFEALGSLNLNLTDIFIYIYMGRPGSRMAALYMRARVAMVSINHILVWLIGRGEWKYFLFPFSMVLVRYSMAACGAWHFSRIHTNI